MAHHFSQNHPQDLFTMQRQLPVIHEKCTMIHKNISVGPLRAFSENSILFIIYSYKKYPSHVARYSKLFQPNLKLQFFQVKIRSSTPAEIFTFSLSSGIIVYHWMLCESRHRPQKSQYQNYMLFNHHSIEWQHASEEELIIGQVSHKTFFVITTESRDLTGKKHR